MSIGISELGLALVAGSLTTLSPCVFPLLPLVIGGGVQSNRLAPLAMGAGMIGSFSLGGVLVGLIGDAVNLDTDIVRLAGACLLLVFGIVMFVPALDSRFSLLLTPLANSANRAAGHAEGNSLKGAFALGALLGLVWSPCSGPLLASALALVASEGGALRGGAVLGAFGLGAAIPLVAVAYASRAGFASFRDRLMSRIGAIKRFFGGVLVVVSVLIITGCDKWIEARVTAMLPDAWILLTTRF
jgi:cytochrome c-type biogenesis protein